MKNINKIVLVAVVAGLSLSSCKKDYLETNPTDQVDAASVLTTTENAKAPPVHDQWREQPGAVGRARGDQGE